MYKNLGFGNSVNFSFPIFTQKENIKQRLSDTKNGPLRCEVPPFAAEFHQ